MKIMIRDTLIRDTCGQNWPAMMETRRNRSRLVGQRKSTGVIIYQNGYQLAHTNISRRQIQKLIHVFLEWCCGHHVHVQNRSGRFFFMLLLSLLLQEVGYRQRCPLKLLRADRIACIRSAGSGTASSVNVTNTDTFIISIGRRWRFARIMMMMMFKGT